VRTEVGKFSESENKKYRLDKIAYFSKSRPHFNAILKAFTTKLNLVWSSSIEGKWSL
jgi:hypothetical protein